MSVIYRSALPDIEIPDVTLTEHVIGGAAARGDRPAFIDGPSGRVTSYAEVAARVDAVAAALQGRGIERGDVVALVGPNSAEWGIAFAAAEPGATPAEIRVDPGDLAALPYSSGTNRGDADGVIGVPMEDGGEAPKACVVCDDGVDTEELVAYVAERVAPYEKIREIERVPEIPKSASGEILRRQLREEHGAARARG